MRRSLGGRNQLTQQSERRNLVGRVSGGPLLPHQRHILAAGMLLMALPRLAMAQEGVIPPDSVRSQIRTVLRAFYLHLESRN